MNRASLPEERSSADPASRNSPAQNCPAQNCIAAFDVHATTLRLPTRAIPLVVAAAPPTDDAPLRLVALLLDVPADRALESIGRALSLPCASASALDLRDESPFAGFLTELERYAAGELTRWSTPVHFRGGTPFQRAVWEAIDAIPAGETRSYGEIARSIGSPGATRAVGSACGRNPIPLRVPCHRVTAASGLGGFTGEMATKRALLQHEGALARPQGSLFPE